ncbi:MAG: hypothetical protein KatS3mg131_3665 [Candidatus Tectimicrobiota bacterium]|nr:MAG: hypothetical protein KatS3mg131_3665 [Candidatus Tectomicrobia bacterium]
MAEERWQGWPMRVQVQEEVRRLFHELIHQGLGRRRVQGRAVAATR